MQRTGGRDRAQDKEHGGIRGNLQVEIKKAVNQDADAAEQGGHGERAAGTFGPVVQFGPGVAEREHKKPDRDCESGEPGFGHLSELIIIYARRYPRTRFENASYAPGAR